MKKLILLSFLAYYSSGTFAQSCTPGANYADSIYGVWPDTVENFPAGTINQFYSTDLNFKVPATVTAELAGNDPIAQGFIGSEIQGFSVDSVSGLPMGFDYACNISSCTYDGGANGCANLYGTSINSGSYPLVIHITATVLVSVPFIGTVPTPVPTSFSGYKLVFGTAGHIEETISPVTIFPNPASDYLTLNGLIKSDGNSIVTLLNVDGSILKQMNVKESESLCLDISMLLSGIYFISVNQGNKTDIFKFIKR